MGYNAHIRDRSEARPLMVCLVVLATLLLFSCGDPSGDSSSTSKQGASVNDAAMAKWSRSCVLCHVNGEGGAPRVGHPEEWVGRVEQGETVLLTHTIEGYKRMPPLGYCMDCEAEDFAALIQFMAHGS